MIYALSVAKKKADDSAFYEEFTTLRLEGLYESGNYDVYIPHSFSKTRNFIDMYIRMFAPR